MSQLTFGKGRGAQTAQAVQFSDLLDTLNNGMEFNDKISLEDAKLSFAMESVSDHQLSQLTHTGEQVLAVIRDVVDSQGMGEITVAQESAAAYAAFIGRDPQGYINRKVETQTVSTESVNVINPMGLSDVVEQRISLESYDQTENRNAVLYSIAYNLLSARQDEFGEALFPTITLPANEVGLQLTLDRMIVFDGYERKLSGAVESWQRKNLIRALADHTILRKEQTTIVPVVRAESLSMFVDPADVAARNIELEGEPVTTAPLKFGAKVDLLGVSQLDSLITLGVMDHTDQVDPAAGLKDIFVKVGDDVLKFDLTNLPLSNFTYNPQNENSTMQLQFNTTSLLLRPETKQVDGSDLVSLDSVVTNELIARLEIAISGTMNHNTGEMRVFANGMSVSSVSNASGESLDLAASPAKELVDLVEAAEPLGYEVQAYRTNSNIRQRGQLLDNRPWTQLYNVPVRSPIAKMRPIGQGAEHDSANLQALLTTTRFRLHNEAVTSAFRFMDQLRNYVDERDIVGEGPDVLGVGRFYVLPTFIERTIKVDEVINSTESHQRVADFKATLVNTLRDLVYRMYRDSEYRAASEALSGGLGQLPKVIIATDQVLARYLNIDGDLRLLGDDFEVVIVQTPDWRMKGKMIVTFGVFDDNRNSAINPLNFGNMIWGPEVVVNSQISRGNTTSHEMIVSPRYLFINNLPVAAMLHVEGVEEAMTNKIGITGDLNVTP